MQAEEFTAQRPFARALSLFALAGLASAMGCGNNYRPVVSSINPVGPAAQPTKYAVAISSPSPTSAGLVTVVDVSGDTVLVTPNIGVKPYYLILGSSGSQGYTLNSDGTLNSFGISTSLQTRNVLQTTLLSGSTPASIFPQSSYTYLAETGRNAIGEFTGTPPALQQEIPTGAGTIYTVGVTNATRVYALSDGTPTGGVYLAGTATAIDTATNTKTNTITVGRQPVYGVMTASGQRAFILNKQDGTVSVINAQTNQLDSFPVSTGSTTLTSTINVGTAPVWADFAPTLNELFVLNQGDGTTPGSVSVISIPLCSTATVVTNPNCDANNPVDAVGFGTTLATIPVGINPQVIGVLQDGTQAYVANSGPTGGQGSISVINLQTLTVTATLPASNSSTVSVNDSLVHGNPGFLAVTTGTPTGKVYVTSPNSNDLTIIETDTDTVLTHISLQGLGVMVRVSQP